MKISKYQATSSIIPPSYRFLLWLIEHPDRLSWPNHGKAKYSEKPQKIREDLIGQHGTERQAEAQQEALAALDQKGAERAHGKWWSFEGTTSVDRFLETENLILLIEGKRTEKLSTSVHWYPGRSQLIRNLEVAQELAGEKQIAVMVIAQEDIGPISQDVMDVSLPHFSLDERNELMRHYLGCLTWRQVCEAVDVPYESLPDTVLDWITGLK